MIYIGKFIDITGNKYGNLTVISRAPNRNKSTMWNCVCDCGKVCVVAGGHLKNGHTTTCGCISREGINNSNYKHGMSHKRLHTIWSNIKQRCDNPHNSKYKNYGGRGITICDDWYRDFNSFKSWAYDNGYSDELSIDRIDVNGNYEPNNCRWATNIEQARNKTNNHLIEYQGKTQTLCEWSEELNIPYTVLESRLNRYGYTVDAAFNK